jgi:hypothetical protein
MNYEHERFYPSRYPLGEATQRATDFISKFILAGGDKTRLEEEVKAIIAKPSAAIRRSDSWPKQLPIPSDSYRYLPMVTGEAPGVALQRAKFLTLKCFEKGRFSFLTEITEITKQGRADWCATSPIPLFTRDTVTTCGKWENF